MVEEEEERGNISICSTDLSNISHIFKALNNGTTVLEEAKESKTPHSPGTLPVGFLFEGHLSEGFQNTHKCFIPFITSSK